MMCRFPSTVTRYIERKIPYIRSCSSGSSENPRRRNSEVLVLFPCSMWLIFLPGVRNLALLFFYLIHFRMSFFIYEFAALSLKTKSCHAKYHMRIVAMKIK
jgi:hypothetical protein